MRGPKKTAAATAAALLLGGGALAAPAPAAGPGETFLAGALPLPPGAIAGGYAGWGLGGAEPVGVSADGRYVAFVATADTLHPDAPLDNINVFRKDRATGEVALVSRADGAAGAPAIKPSTRVKISGDGNRIAFVTDAGLDPGDLDGRFDVYVRDVAGGRTLLATPGTPDDVYDYDLAGDGSAIAFTTKARLSVNDNNTTDDVYRRTLVGGISLVSARSGSAQPGDAASGSPSISDDGGWVAFSSRATDLVAGFVNNDVMGTDVFVRDMAAGTTHLVSNKNGLPNSGSAGSEEGEPVIAGAPATGATASVFVAYTSNGTDIDPADTASDASIFVRQLSADSSRLVSRADGNGPVADSRAHTASISDDGRRIAFATDAGNLGPGGGRLSAYGAYVRDTGTSRTSLVSMGHDYAIQAAISGDGGTVAWIEQFHATPDGDPDLPGVFARSYGPPLGPVGYVSRPAGDAPYRAPALNVGLARSGTDTISADGRWVVFSSVSHHLPGSGGRLLQVYRRDTLTGAIELVSRATGDGPAADRDSLEATISADGTRVAFATYAALDPADLDNDEDVYVRDLAAGTTTLASRADGADGPVADAGARDPAISADGRRVVFVSAATNFGVPGGRSHAYVRDLTAATTTLVDRADGPAGVVAGNDAQNPVISGDGRIVAWQTYARNLDPVDAGGLNADIYVRDLAAATTTLVSRRSGAAGQKAAGDTYDPALSDDGRVVAFQAMDENLAPEGGPWGGRSHVVARDLATHENRLVSRAPGGEAANASSGEPALDGDGSVVAFSSQATNLLPGVGGLGRTAVFARDAATGALSGPPAFGLVDIQPQTRAYGPSLSADGQCMAFAARGHNAITGAAGDIDTLYVHVLAGACPKPLPDDSRPPVTPISDRPGAAVKPVVSKASLLRKRFRVGKGATAVTAAVQEAIAEASASKRGKAKKKKRKPTPAGTAFRFTLNTRANVAIAIERKTRGRKVGKQCRRATRKLRKRKACVRWVKAGTLKRNGSAAGRRTVAFSGRIGRKALAPGSYRATIKASNSAGTSKPVTLAFTVVRR